MRDKVCDWGQVRDLAAGLWCEINEEPVHVWDSPGKAAWIRQAWDILFTKGLTEYGNDLEKNGVQCQVLTLAAMYCRFLEFSTQQTVTVDYGEWFSRLNLSLWQIQLITGEDCEAGLPCPDDDTYAEEFADREAAWQQNTRFRAGQALTEFYRQRVHQVLLEHFGGPEQLLLSFFLSQSSGRETLYWIEAGMKLDQYADIRIT